MKDIRVAKRYAGALFAVAQRDNILDAVASDLTLIHRFLTEVPYLRAIIMQPLVSGQPQEQCRRRSVRGPGDGGVAGLPEAAHPQGGGKS